MRIASMCAIALLAIVPAAFASDDDEPLEYKDRSEQREAWRRGYERGFERGYQRGLLEGERRAAAMPPPPPAKPMPTGPIHVIQAHYGTGRKSCDATRYLRKYAEGRRTYSFKVSNEMCGDPAHGDRKTLEVSYRCGAMHKSVSAREHQPIYLDCTS